MYIVASIGKEVLLLKIDYKNMIKNDFTSYLLLCWMITIIASISITICLFNHFEPTLLALLFW